MLLVKKHKRLFVMLLNKLNYLRGHSHSMVAGGLDEMS